MTAVRILRPGAVVGFSTFAEFLKHAVDQDCQFLLEEELERFSPAACGMANGAGGWIVLGAALGEEGGTPVVKGVRNPVVLRERLKLDLAQKEVFSARLSASFFVLNETGTGGDSLLLIGIQPARWHDRPVSVRGAGHAGRAYRRVEGENLISGRGTRFRLGLDALERLRDDRPVKGMEVSDLDEASVAAFRLAVTKHKREWARLSDTDFLSRALVLSDGAVTQAGNYLLGREGVKVRIELQNRADELEFHNLWRAYALLPRLAESFSEPCAAAFAECLVNTLLHADYDAGGVRITMSGSPLSVRFENPGLPRTCENGESACRNFRLLKMFQLFGAARGEGRGLGVVRRYQPDFELEEEPLELTTAASLRLEPRTPPKEAAKREG